MAVSRVREGIVLVSAMHISASVFVNDHESGLWQDILKWLEETIAPWDPPATGTTRPAKTTPRPSPKPHHRPRGDRPDHRGGKLDLGPWQRVFYGEWDGQRRKRVVIKVLGEE